MRALAGVVVVALAGCAAVTGVEGEAPALLVGADDEAVYACERQAQRTGFAVLDTDLPRKLGRDTEVSLRVSRGGLIHDALCRYDSFERRALPLELLSGAGGPASAPDDPRRRFLMYRAEARDACVDQAGFLGYEVRSVQSSVPQGNGIEVAMAARRGGGVTRTLRCQFIPETSTAIIFDR